MSNKAKTYTSEGTNPSIEYSDSSKANLAFCFSGGGSRALTCAWGQLLGLTTLGLTDNARYISSVSGGTWATSVYNFLPETIATADLLGTYFPPQQLSLVDAEGKLNVTSLAKYSMGQSPSSMSLGNLVKYGLLFLILHDESEHKWLWAYIVGKFVLDHYGLRSVSKHAWESTKHFTLSAAYAKANFPAGSPSVDDFYFLRNGRPYHVMNDNIMEEVAVTGKDTPNIVQIPNQATPVSTGARGQNPATAIVGGGTVESYGYNSTLDQKDATASPVDIQIAHTYSLIDAVSTSSAFFAETLASLMKEQLDDSEKKKAIISELKALLKPDDARTLLSRVKKDLSFFKDLSLEKKLETVLEDLDLAKSLELSTIIPSYNYWPVASSSANKETKYTDGGTLENTGVLGMLSQSDSGGTDQQPISLVAFDNTATPLEKVGDKIVAAGQIARLFGISSSTGKAYTAAQKDPTNPIFDAASLTVVFENTPDASGITPFEQLVQGLYESSCEAGVICSNAAFCQLQLTTIVNPLARVSAGRKVNLFYVQNAKILNWQNQIGDENLKNEIATGQLSATGAMGDFKDFPYYNTITKIGLAPKESHALSQMWAWALANDDSPLKKQLEAFTGNA